MTKFTLDDANAIDWGTIYYMHNNNKDFTLEENINWNEIERLKKLNQKLKIDTLNKKVDIWEVKLFYNKVLYNCVQRVERNYRGFEVFLYGGHSFISKYMKWELANNKDFLKVKLQELLHLYFPNNLKHKDVFEIDVNFDIPLQKVRITANTIYNQTFEKLIDVGFQ